MSKKRLNLDPIPISDGATIRRRDIYYLMVETADGQQLTIHVDDVMDLIAEPELYLISAYECSNYYGGPEEGGWWFDWLTLETDVEPFVLSTAAAAYEMALQLNQREGAETRTLSNGTPDRIWRVEINRGEHNTTQAPRYE